MLTITFLLMCVPGPEISARLLTPAQVLAEADELYGNGTTDRHPIEIRFNVESAEVQKWRDEKNQEHQLIVLSAPTADERSRRFHVAITAKGQQELIRVGVSDFKKHFAGKQVQFRGELKLTWDELYPANTIRHYHVDVSSLDQIIAVKEIARD